MFRGILVGLVLSALVLVTYSIAIPRQPAPELIQLAVRATLHAMPTSTAIVVEVTRVVEVTSTPGPTATPILAVAATQTPTATETATPVVAGTLQIEPQAAAASASFNAALPAAEAALVAPEQAAIAPTATAPTEEGALAEVAASKADSYASVQTCPTSSTRSYDLIPVAGGGLDHPHDQHGDLNLSLRGYGPVDAVTALVDINGPTDGDAPQIAGVLPGTTAQLASAYRVNEWDWGCGERGCRSGSPVTAAVSLVGLSASPGAPISIPSRGAEIYGGGYTAMVLYAEENRLTLVYTREDSVANGYSVHLENICVDPELLNAYRVANEAGRQSLPAIRNGEVVGVAVGNEVAVAVRDRGAFGDPRSRKDWWR